MSRSSSERRDTAPSFAAPSFAAPSFAAPSFAARARALVRGVPRGQVIGYGQVAALLGSARAARQVGWAMASLPVDTDVPWHRVIRSSGGIAFEGDVHRALLQRAKLEEEGVDCGPSAQTDPAGWRVDMRRFGWLPDLDTVQDLLAGLTEAGREA